MKRRRAKPQPIAQPTSAELLGSCLSFLQRKFYQGHEKKFAQDRDRLLQWVVLWPAKWFTNRGVTIPPDRYREIFFHIFSDAQVFGAEKIEYLPAWLSKVIHSHFDHNGEDYYREAKSMRTLAEHALLFAKGNVTQAAPNPIEDLARASRLLRAKKRVFKQPVKAQLTLFGPDPERA